LLSGILKKRSKFSHKGTFGHALLIAGSYGKMGAAILSSRACLRSGVGLLTTHLPKSGVEIIQTSVPECMVSADDSETVCSKLLDLYPFSAIGIGPGLGTKTETRQALLTLINSQKLQLVIDADALNLLAENQELIKNLPPNTILTPHPKEFERLAGASENSFQRLQKQIQFSAKYSVIIVGKGAYTCITFPDGRVFFNSTGNPGMATAGSGDVLTGIILGLLAQHYSPEESALLGVFLHGLAGDFAAEQFGQHAMIAGDIIDQLGNAFSLLE
jgi:NAD(P)H-hydrate epimerase